MARRHLLMPAARLAGLLLSLLLVWWLVSPVVVGRFEERLRRALPQGELSLEAPSAGHPATVVNAPARRLESLAARLGIDIVPTGRPGPRLRDSKARERLVPVLQSLYGFLSIQELRADDGLDRLPTAVLEFLSTNETLLEEIRGHLLEAEPPVWEYEPDRSFRAAVTNFRGMSELQKLLLAAPFELARRGDTQGALKALEPSIRLNEAFSERPEMLDHILRTATSRAHQRLLRVLDAVPGSAEERLSRNDPVTGLVVALRAEVAMWGRLGRAPLEYEPGERIDRLFAPVMTPWVQIQALDFGAHLQRAVNELALLDPCTATPESLARVWGRRPESWNRLLEAWPDYSGISQLMLRAALSRELTSLIVRLKRRDGGPPSPVASNVCRGETWSYTLDANGGLLEVSFSRRLREPYRDSWPLPLRYSRRRKP